MRHPRMQRAATAAFLAGLAGTCLAVERVLGAALMPALGDRSNKPVPSDDYEWRVGYVVPYRVRRPKPPAADQCGANAQLEPITPQANMAQTPGEGHTDAEGVALLSL